MLKVAPRSTATATAPLDPSSPLVGMLDGAMVLAPFKDACGAAAWEAAAVRGLTAAPGP